MLQKKQMKRKIVLSKKLRPQDFLVDRPKNYQKTGRNCNRIEFRARYRGLNWTYFSDRGHDLFVRIYSKIHYLTGHAPEKVTRRWNQAAIRLNNRSKWWRAGINDRL